MRLLQKLVLSHELVGEALVPYYRQLLPVFNLCMGSNKNLGDCIDYGQNHTPCLGELAASTLALFELHGGPTAFVCPCPSTYMDILSWHPHSTCTHHAQTHSPWPELAA